MKAIIWSALFCGLLSACGGGGEPGNGDGTPGDNTQQPPVDNQNPMPPVVYAQLQGSDTVTNQVVQLLGDQSQASESGELSFTWAQAAGPAVMWIDEPTVANPRVLLPSVTQATNLELELTVTEGALSASDSLSLTVVPCGTNVNIIFGERCVSGAFGPLIAYHTSTEYQGLYHTQNEAGRHVAWDWKTTGDQAHPEVLEVTFNHDDRDHVVDAKGWIGIALANEAGRVKRSLAKYANGALVFDLKVTEYENASATAGMIVKMECGHPCQSAELPITNAHLKLNEWHTYTFPIQRFIDSGLDINQVDFTVMIHPRWYEQDRNVRFELDNVRFDEIYRPPEPGEGCIASGNVTYQLARAANPNADQTDAYNLITQAMDVAVEKYNCYTNLTRHLYVEYNPSVATADGSSNGTIRFGSRASMHHVTAMHEISHVFGVGTHPNYRVMVQDGVLTGQLVTTKLRELTGDSVAVIKSDGTHLWPYGLNYISEGETEEDLRRHCLIIEALVADFANF